MEKANKNESIVKICNQVIVQENFEADKILVKRFEDGLCSDIYRVDFSNTPKIIEGKVTKNLVVKLFGPEPPYDVNKSVLNSIIIGQEKLGPKIYLSQDNALVMEFINGRSFNDQDDKNEKHFQLLAKKMACFHSLQVPVPKNRYIEQIKYVLEDWMNENTWNDIYGEFQPLLKKNNCHNLLQGKSFIQKEIQYLKNNILAMDPNIVFCHQDMNHSNILLLDDSTNGLNIKFIDFDYAGYNYRALDIGRYFSDCEKSSKFSVEPIIDDEKMIKFINYYINENCRIYGDQYRNDPKNSPLILLKESKFFVLYAQMIDVFFLLWSVRFNEQKFGTQNEYCKMAEDKFSEFLLFKNRIQETFI